MCALPGIFRGVVFEIATCGILNHLTMKEPCDEIQSNCRIGDAGRRGAALAQSSVTLYGSMDLTMPWISDVRGSRLTRMDSAISQPDLWGLRGSEDLGAA